jgi:hypothetical protein
MPTTDVLRMNIKCNQDRGPITRRKSFWLGSVGADITSAVLCKGDECPREIRVFQAGNLNVTYRDGTSEIITGITAGTVFTDGCWISISATNSTAYNLSVGW